MMCNIIIEGNGSFVTPVPGYLLHILPKRVSIGLKIDSPEKLWN